MRVFLMSDRPRFALEMRCLEELTASGIGEMVAEFCDCLLLSVVTRE
jgi:hypothetical protein